MKKIVVIYHGNCHDGFSGAWAAWKKFGNKADYYPAHRQKPPPTGLNNKEIYFIDFVYPAEITKRIVENSKKVVILDHHISAKNDIKLAHEYVYDLKRSGAVIAWHYFFPKKTTPRFLKHIEDQDLWNFKLPHTREISIAIQFTNFSFKTWDKLVKDIESSAIRKKYIEKGRSLLHYQSGQIEELADSNSYPVKFVGHQVLAANAPHFFASQLGHLLAKKHPPFAIIWNQMGDTIRVSLRAYGNKVDVSKIAAKYGGGGHKAAAGFAFTTNKRPPWKLTN